MKKHKCQFCNWRIKNCWKAWNGLFFICERCADKEAGKLKKKSSVARRDRTTL